jgi:hypothetical protein
MIITLKVEDSLDISDRFMTIDLSRMIIIGKIFYKVNDYNGKNAYFKFSRKSIIDGFPIFEIDTIQIDREEKLSKILE